MFQIILFRGICTVSQVKAFSIRPPALRCLQRTSNMNDQQDQNQTNGFRKRSIMMKEWSQWFLNGLKRYRYLPLAFLIAASTLSLSTTARADLGGYGNNFKNTTGKPVYDFHIETLNGGAVITVITGGRINGLVQQNWTPALLGGNSPSNGGSLTAGAGQTPVADGESLGMHVTFVKGFEGPFRYEWWWTDKNGARVGKINTPEPSTTASMGGGCVLLALLLISRRCKRWTLLS
jgi:hypothetical protein